MQSKQTQQLVERIFRFNKLMHTHMAQMSDCSPGELKMLTAITCAIDEQKEQGSELPGISASKISKILMHSKPATSKMLNTLEAKGDIERIYSKLDRRTVFITVTEKGRERADQFREETDAYTNKILERLGVEKTNQMFECMDALYEIVKEIHEEDSTKNKQ
ncbi:MAG: MarR family transcriptional regulator [bacterium]|nr:MarR family transcriptional regulator [bacterium]